MSNPVGRRLGKSGAAAAVGTTLATTALAALANAPARFARLFHKRYPLIAVTGMTGVGKTALSNRLSRTSGAETADGGSATLDHGTRRTPRWPRLGGHGRRDDE